MAVVDWKQGLRRITFHIDRAVKPLPPGPLEPRTDLYTLVHGVSCWGYDLDVGRDYVLFEPDQSGGSVVESISSCHQEACSFGSAKAR